jgi:hypothetical protein
MNGIPSIADVRCDHCRAMRRCAVITFDAGASAPGVVTGEPERVAICEACALGALCWMHGGSVELRTRYASSDDSVHVEHFVLRPNRRPPFTRAWWREAWRRRP